MKNVDGGNESETKCTDCQAIKMHTCGHSLMEIIKKENSYIRTQSANQQQITMCIVHH